MPSSSQTTGTQGAANAGVATHRAPRYAIAFAVLIALAAVVWLGAAKPAPPTIGTIDKGAMDATGGPEIGRDEDGTFVAYGDPGDALDQGKVRLPTRLSDDRRPGAPLLPALPEAADRLRPMTIELQTRPVDAQAGEQVKVISRTRDRVHVASAGRGHEWLFTRNPLDGRRMSGQLIDHRRRVILAHHESELRDAGIANSWADVIALGVDLRAMEGLERTSETRTRDGVAFHKYRPRKQGPDATRVSELWFSKESLLPLFVLNDTPAGRMVTEIRRITAGVDGSLLRSPEKRFPDYESLDLVDWREEHHAEAHGGPAHIGSHSH